jgi:DNA-binding NarL/FixJ family response regulator
VFVAEPGTGDFAVIREASERAPGVKPIVLSSAVEPARIDAAFAAGAVAYVLKTAQQDDIRVAIRQAFEHSVFVRRPDFANGAVAAPAAVKPVASDVVATLTKRELEILQLVAEGHSNSQLARILWVTEQTVKFHLSNIYRKLDVANRTEASRWAQLHGLLDTSAHAASL